jgi:hypothetical protein
MQGLLAVTNWAAENDEAIVDEPVHECRVPGPAVLVADLTRGVPAWAVDQPYRKMGHDRSVRAIADIRGYPCAAGTPTISTSGLCRTWQVSRAALQRITGAVSGHDDFRRTRVRPVRSSGAVH